MDSLWLTAHMAEATSLQRVAYSPGEFAELFGKSQTWGYRQIYAGKVNAITEHGRILIAAKEVERILESAGIYNGREKPKQAKARVEKLTIEQKTIWRKFVESRKEGGGKPSQPSAAKKARKHPSTAATSGQGTSARENIAKTWARHAPKR